ncbi:MAG: hypothetical protein KAH17_05470 [Bacteroidales bacterium]|nr:hypothetical protein [Bacteroidales bacterium]
MLLRVIQIGNSKGIRLSKTILEKCQITDAAVLNSGVKLQTYARSLQKELFVNKNQKLASYFRGSTLKKRMLMATRSNPQGSAWKYLLILPLLAISLLTFSFVNDPIDNPFGNLKNDRFVILIDPGHGGKDRSIKVVLLRDKDVFISMQVARCRK